MTPEQKKAISDSDTPQDIVNMLRGIYKATPGTQERIYPVTPLQKRAADLIEKLLAEKSAPTPPTQEVPEDLRIRIRDAIAVTLGDSYDRTRFWSAWGVVTMSQDDVVPVAEDEDRLQEIVDAVLKVLPPAQVAEPEFSDGCDHEGFPGGCERFGHTAETCPTAHPVNDELRKTAAEALRVYEDAHSSGHAELHRAMDALSAALEAAPTPPAQEAEPSTFRERVISDLIKHHVIVEEPDKLRQAAEEVKHQFNRAESIGMPAGLLFAIVNLISECDKKP